MASSSLHQLHLTSEFMRSGHLHSEIMQLNPVLRPGGYFVWSTSAVSHTFQGAIAMKVSYNERAPNQPPLCDECSMLVWNYGDTTIVCVPLVTRLQLVPEMMAIGELPTVLCILRTTQIIGDIGKAENGHTGSYISIDLAQYAEMDGRDSSDDYSDLVGNYSYSYAHTRRVDGGYSGSLWLYSMFCLPNMGPLYDDSFEKASLSLADNLERIRQKRLLRKLVVVMVVSKDAKCVALGSSNGEICVVEVKQMEHKLADLRNHISFQGVNLPLPNLTAVLFYWLVYKELGTQQ
ncbi:hypothetical protein ACLB2K_071701 [Fragaria x ananassa]